MAVLCVLRSNPGNEIELDKAVGRVRDVFTKAWGGEAAYLGLWLDKILSNSVYLLLENSDPGYTLVDIPLVVDEDTTFRNELLKKVKVTTALEDFSYREFDRLTRRDRTEQVGPALTRLNTLRTNHILRGIVGQKDSSIDFSEILSTGKIVLLRMPSYLDKTVQNLIGTLVLSEFLYAVHERGKLAERDRPYFGVYCDEFQRFATPDFADLFMQTGKFKSMPVVAHQTREQFKGRDDPNRGATAASPNKVFFTFKPRRRK